MGGALFSDLDGRAGADGDGGQRFDHDMGRIDRQRDSRGEQFDGAGLLVGVLAEGQGRVGVRVSAVRRRRVEPGVELVARADDTERQHQDGAEGGEKPMSGGRRTIQGGGNG